MNSYIDDAAVFFKNKRNVWIILTLIVLLGAALRYRSFQNVGVTNWVWDVPIFLNMATHLDKGFYNYDKRALLAYKSWEDFLNKPFHRDEKLLSKYGKKPIPDKYYVNDQGITLIYWLAFKCFGDETPLKSVWKLQFIVDMLSILGIFLISSMIFGNIEGLIAAFFYSVNAFAKSFSQIPFFPVQNTYYYYWMGPFAIITTLFWVWIFKKESDCSISKFKRYVLFILYAMFAGLFSLVRTNARFILPYIGFFYIICGKKERRAKVAAILVGLLVQSAFLIPLVMYNKKEVGKYTTVTRYVWHQIFVGIGFYDNKYGLTFDDVKAVRVAEKKYGVKKFDWKYPTIDQIRTYEAAMKKEVMKIAYESPEIFIKNALRNLYYGFLLAPKSDENLKPTYKTRFDFNLYRMPSINYSIAYALLLCSGLIYFFRFDRTRFYMTLLLLLIASYFLLTVCLVNPPYVWYIFGYYPIFYILFAACGLNSLKAISLVFKKAEPSSIT